MNEIEELKRQIIEEANKAGVKGDISPLIEICQNDKNALKEVLHKIPLLKKKLWYVFVKVGLTSKKVEWYKMTPSEVGKPLENLVEIGLQQLGCNVTPQRIIPLNYPQSFRGEGKFKNDKVVFKRLPNVRNKPDFVSEKIAIEVKNRDPKHPYKTKKLFKEEVLDRFKRVRVERKRYLLIPKGVLTSGQRKELKKRKIKEVNIKEQLRRTNEKKVYTDVFKALKRILNLNYP